jgi:hypothetical protein
VKFAKGKVTFEYYDNRHGGKLKEMTLPAVEFIGCFLLHVLPKRFQRIQHYGLHHGGCREKLRQARQALGLGAQLPAVVKLKLVEWLAEVLESDDNPRRCSRCGQGLLMRVREFGPTSNLRAKLGSLLLGGLFKWKLAF